MKWFSRLKGNIPDNFYRVLEKIDSMGVKRANNLPVDIGNGNIVLIASYEFSGRNRFFIQYVSKQL